MNTVIGIAVLVVCVIGAVSMLNWIFKQAAKLFKPYDNSTLLSVGRSEEYFDKKLTNFADLPHYQGETGMFGLPRYRDVMVPNKHNYATVVYMDHAVKQWVYDWMASCKAVATDKDNPYGPFSLLCFLAIPFLFSKALGVACLVVALLLFIFGAPSGKRAVRRSAENARNFTKDDWRGIYRDVVESIEREDELARAIRKSGIRRWRY